MEQRDHDMHIRLQVRTGLRAIPCSGGHSDRLQSDDASAGGLVGAVGDRIAVVVIWGEG